MARIGQSLTPVQAKRLADQRLVPGTVVVLTVTIPSTRQTKEKFLVYLGQDEGQCYFVVNTKINRLVQRNPKLLRCQVLIDAASHPFLTHDSHVACHEVLNLQDAEVYTLLCDDLTRIKGVISDAVRDQILAAVKHAVTLSPRLQNLILTALSSSR